MKPDALRPYLALFAAQFQLTLQYRAAAFAGFVTQCWWGMIKVMVLTAFFAAGGATHAPISLAQTITYVWLAQGFLVLQPWAADPAVTAAMRTGTVALENIRPVDLYAWWYVRAAATAVSRAAPRAGLMALFACVLLPLLGLYEWSLRPPPSLAAWLLFTVSLVLTVALSAAFVMLLNVVVVGSLNERGINTLAAMVVMLFCGGEIPLPLLPDWLHLFLFVQPFAGIADIPFRIYVGHLDGAMALAGLALQAFWTLAFVLMGRAGLSRVLRQLEVQGG